LKALSIVLAACASLCLGSLPESAASGFEVYPQYARVRFMELARHNYVPAMANCGRAMGRVFAHVSEEKGVSCPVTPGGDDDDIVLPYDLLRDWGFSLTTDQNGEAGLKFILWWQSNAPNPVVLSREEIGDIFDQIKP
jgi:hypothetical protein